MKTARLSNRSPFLAATVLSSACLTGNFSMNGERTGHIWTAVAERSGDTAVERSVPHQVGLSPKGGVALRFPPQSMTLSRRRLRALPRQSRNLNALPILPIKRHL